MNEQRPTNSPVLPNRTPLTTPGVSKLPTASTDSRPDSIGLAAQSAPGTVSKIKTFGGEAAASTANRFTRTPNVSGFGACRVRSFIGKISGPGLEFLDNNINLWLDQHPEVEIKFVTSTVGGMDGKSETAIVMNLWY